MTDTHTSRPDSLATTEGGEASSAAIGVDPANLAGMHALLQQVTLAQLIARKPPTTVTVVPADWTIERALQQCAAKNLLATPVVDADTSNCFGFFDINDALKAVCSWFDIHNVSNHDRIARLHAAGTTRNILFWDALRFVTHRIHRHQDACHARARHRRLQHRRPAARKRAHQLVADAGVGRRLPQPGR